MTCRASAAYVPVMTAKRTRELRSRISTRFSNAGHNWFIQTFNSELQQS